MSNGTCPDTDQVDFIYSPEQPLTTEQRIELLEIEISEIREQIHALLERFSPAEA
jgi:hypothetical protein